MWINRWKWWICWRKSLKVIHICQLCHCFDVEKYKKEPKKVINIMLTRIEMTVKVNLHCDGRNVVKRKK